MSGKKIHFIGIGGVGMAALAVLLKARGDTVTGCDLHPSPRTRWLERQGIPVDFGHDARHVAAADVVVVTPAVHADNPEFVAAQGKIRYRGEVLAELTGARASIAVCGAHGKTTTATFIAKLLRALGEKVSWAIGGETGDFPVAAENGGVLVVEADESDGTLSLYRPTTLVVNKCEYDHPDHFKTPDDYFACFATAQNNAQDVILAENLEIPSFFINLFGVPPHANGVCLHGLAPHNLRNARAAAEVALRRGHTWDAICAALPAVVAQLPDRRFQTLAPGVVTDYAHHPTEMRCAIDMARQICRGTLRVLFQPHRYSRTKALLKDFPAAFAGADEVVLCPTYAAFEPPVAGGDSADLYAACREAFARAEPPSRREGPRVLLAQSCAEAWRHARLEMQGGDVTLLLGAGDIINLAPAVVRDRAQAVRGAGASVDLKPFSFFRTGGRSVGGGGRVIAGAGSNTWISDLTTDADYVKVAGPAGATGATLGIPWMAGVPGTIGGWVKMNAGAFGHSISEVVRRVKVDGRWIDRADCGFGYRTSAIAGVIEDVEWELGGVAAAEPARAFLARRKRFPARCCGSVFKNPPGDFAGRLLEAAGAKGLRVGGAFVWEEHANVIVAGDGATSSDILALARLMQLRVRDRFGIVLEPEIRGLVLS